MIELRGSEKQVAWANDIRNNNIKVLERELSEYKDREVRENYSYSHITEKIEKALVDIKEGQPEAKWWIEHQNIAGAFLQRIKKGAN